MSSVIGSGALLCAHASPILPVTTQDMDGVSHTVEVTAGTLYEAVAQGARCDPHIALVQLRVLRLGLLQDGDVGVFPEGEEVFVGGERPDTGGVRVRSL
jgi:hypothetical protein